MPVTKLARLVPMRRLVVISIVAVVVGLVYVVNPPHARAAGPCGPPVTSVIACENTQPGDPTSDWQVSGAGDSTIQGFATVDERERRATRCRSRSAPRRRRTTSTSCGWATTRATAPARSPATAAAATLPQTQPACLNDATAPGSSTAATGRCRRRGRCRAPRSPGVYLAHLVRNDTGGSSLIPFVVRNDASHSDIVVQTSDETWQAYNTYGGNSLYTCTVNCPPGNPHGVQGRLQGVLQPAVPHRAATTAAGAGSCTPSTPMIRFLEANGYDVSYMSGLDVATRRVAAAQPQDLPLDRPRRVLVRPAAGQRRGRPRRGREPGVLQRQRGVLEDPAGAEHRQLEHRRTGRWSAYKETHYDAPVDPQDPPTWTGTWMDPRFSPPADGGRPQNALTGQLLRRQLRHHRHHGAGAVRQAPVLAEHRGRQPERRASPLTLGAGRRHARLRVGRRPRQRVPARRAVRPVLDDRQQRGGLHRLRRHDPDRTAPRPTT